MGDAPPYTRWANRLTVIDFHGIHLYGIGFRLYQAGIWEKKCLYQRTSNRKNPFIRQLHRLPA